MNTRILHRFALGLIFFLGIPALVAASDNPWQRKLPFKHATINYDISGMETGTETLYIKDYGKYRALNHDGTTSMLGITTRTHRLEITDPDWHYTFDLEANTGTKVTNPSKFYQEEFAKLTAAEKANVEKNAQELGISMLGDLNGQVEPNATEILGYSCDRTTIMGMTINLIHDTDVPLLSEMNIMGMQAKIKATSIDTGKPSSDVFALPAGIDPRYDREADEAARQMAVSAINTLKEPDGAEKMKARMKDQSPQDNPAMQEYRDREGYRDEGPDAGSASGLEDEMQPQDEEDTFNKSMQEGMDMLKGLFGN